MKPAIPVMNKQVAELEAILTQMLSEQRKMVTHIDAHTAAMKAMDAALIEQVGRMQEAARARIAALDATRKSIAAAIARQYRLPSEPSIRQLAEMFPHQMPSLLQLREDLKSSAVQLVHRNHIAGRLAGALLGHLNTAVRFIAGSVNQKATYTKHGVPRISGRIGAIEAVG